MPHSGQLCKDCRHYRRFLLFEPTCALVPKDHNWSITNKVTGAVYFMGNRYCISQRALDEEMSGYRYCGPQGRYWEPKP